MAKIEFVFDLTVENKIPGKGSKVEHPKEQTRGSSKALNLSWIAQEIHQVSDCKVNPEFMVMPYAVVPSEKIGHRLITNRQIPNHGDLVHRLVINRFFFWYEEMIGQNPLICT